jgi:hypothetical protein
VTIGNDGSDESGSAFADADPADVAEQQQSVDPDAGNDVIDDDAVEIAVEAEPADVLEQRRPVGGEEDYPRG